MKLGIKIKSAREEQGITQQKLADISGISRASIQLYERDKVDIPLNKIEILSNALGINADYFLSTNMSTNDKKSEDQSEDQKIEKSEDQNVRKSVANDGYWITTITHPASAGTSSDIQDIEVSDSTEKMFVPSTLFKTKVNSTNIRILKVDGYSMTPMLYPDSWVIIDLCDTFTQDGLYVINYQNILMVKLLQILPNGNLYIKSTNKDYDSYEIKEDTQLVFNIIGKVLRCII